MLTKLFLSFSLLGAEWVMFLLILISIYSVAIMFERSRFYSNAEKGLEEFRKKIRDALQSKEWDRAKEIVKSREAEHQSKPLDLETELVKTILNHSQSTSVEVLNEVGNDSVLIKKINYDRSLSTLATIGSNAPFIGLFGTVLGIIKAFHDLAEHSASGGNGAGASTVMAGVSEALVATGVGILVAIPAVIAYNAFQKRTKTALMNAEAMKSFLVSKVVGHNSASEKS